MKKKTSPIAEKGQEKKNTIDQRQADLSPFFSPFYRYLSHKCTHTRIHATRLCDIPKAPNNQARYHNKTRVTAKTHSTDCLLVVGHFPSIMDTVMSSSKEPPHYERSKNLEAVARDAASAWTKLPEPWKVDKEFILRALKESPTLPSKSDFERRFPQSLRFDKEVVLGFCSRPDFSELYYSRHLYVPGCLNGDKDVMLAYCQTIPRSLQECTEELCNDRQVVEAAVRLGGLELQYASLELQRDRPLVETACRSHGRALEFCPPGPTRTSLTQDREFMLNTVLAKPGGGPMWKLAPSSLQGDEQLLLQALKHGLLLRPCN